MDSKKPKTIDEHIGKFPEDRQAQLTLMRVTIGKAAPQAEEVISYQMPAFRQNGILVYFAGLKHHIGFYPTSSAIHAFQKEIARFKSSKGAVQFPLDQKIPTSLITRIVKFRLKKDREKAKKKGNTI